ncbi:hypothetical protein OC845_006907, partial [Tilletia horrida]
ILRSESWQSPVQGSLNFQLVKSTTVNALDNTGEEGEQGLTRIEVIVDLDAWIERTLLRLADSVNPQLRSKQALPTCEDAEDAINADASRISVLLPSRGTDPKRRVDPARSTKDQDEEDGAKSLRIQGDAHEHSDSDGIHPLLRACAAKPGLRERVRRAARRLAILDPEHWAVNLAAADASEKVTARLELWNNGKLMHSLADINSSLILILAALALAAYPIRAADAPATPAADSPVLETRSGGTIGIGKGYGAGLNGFFDSVGTGHLGGFKGGRGRHGLKFKNKLYHHANTIHHNAHVAKVDAAHKMNAAAAKSIA